MSKTRETRIQDIVTDKAMWLAEILVRPEIRTKNELFHLIREHYGILVGEILASILLEREDGQQAPKA